jgi:hypothetical protein
LVSMSAFDIRLNQAREREDIDGHHSRVARQAGCAPSACAGGLLG